MGPRLCPRCVHQSKNRPELWKASHRCTTRGGRGGNRAAGGVNHTYIWQFLCNGGARKRWLGKRVGGVLPGAVLFSLVQSACIRSCQSAESTEATAVIVHVPSADECPRRGARSVLQLPRPVSGQPLQGKSPGTAAVPYLVHTTCARSGRGGEGRRKRMRSTMDAFYYPLPLPTTLVRETKRCSRGGPVIPSHQIPAIWFPAAF